MKGWYVSNSRNKNVSDTRKNEHIPTEITKQEITETVNVCSVEKAPEIDLEASTSKEIRIKEQVSFDNGLEIETDTAHKQITAKSTFNNKAFLIGEYTTFGVSICSAVIGNVMLNSFVTMATVFFAMANILFLTSIILSLIAIRKITKLDLDHKLWPHKLILGFAITCFCLAISLVVVLLTALATQNPYIIIAAGAVTFLLLMSKAFSKL